VLPSRVLDLEAVAALLRSRRAPLRHVGKLRQVLDEDQLHAADAQFILGHQPTILAQLLGVEVRTVQAAEIADEPASFGGVNLGVFAAAQVIPEHDAIGRRPAQSVPSAVLQRVNVPEPIVPADDEKRTWIACGHELTIERRPPPGKRRTVSRSETPVCRHRLEGAVR
jgi:hypothetical protein